MSIDLLRSIFQSGLGALINSQDEPFIELYCHFLLLETGQASPRSAPRESSLFQGVAYLVTYLVPLW
jgi:hypothetical protein